MLQISYDGLLNEVRSFWQPLPDKPEETPEGILRALWITAAGKPVSVPKALYSELPVLDEAAAARLRDLIERKKAGVPLSYLTGRQNFLGLELIAGPGALIPRKETEIVGKAALAKLKSLVQERGQALVLDVCTGCGNLALAYASHEPRCRVKAADLSLEAVELANRNLQHTGLEERVEFRCGDLLAPFETEEILGHVDLLSCNPPYISSAKVPTMAKEISGFEPELAFDGGALGISILTKLIANSPRFLRPGAWLCFELGLGQGPWLIRQLRKNPAFAEVEMSLDEAGEIRALSARAA